MSPEVLAADIRAEIAALPRRDTPHLRVLRKARSAALAETPATEVAALARRLEAEALQEEKWLAYELLRFHPGAFATITEAEVEDYAGRTATWQAVDGFGTILVGPLWARGKVSDARVSGWAGADSRWLRRLALVATVGRNGRPNAPDVARTLAVCRRLVADRDDMVDKAMSWALRFLAQRGAPDAVAGFCAEQGDALSARVRREVRHKLHSGVKSGRRKGTETTN
jgi:3-methyladenine DNA glycosylase AlkD